MKMLVRIYEKLLMVPGVATYDTEDMEPGELSDEDLIEMVNRYINLC
jgi:hypothetical protein